MKAARQVVKFNGKGRSCNTLWSAQLIRVREGTVINALTLHFFPKSYIIHFDLVNRRHVFQTIKF